MKAVIKLIPSCRLCNDFSEHYLTGTCRCLKRLKSLTLEETALADHDFPEWCPLTDMNELRDLMNGVKIA